MKRLALAVASLLCTTGCFDLLLPEKPPPPQPGTLQGTVMYAVAGRTTQRPAAGALVQLVNTTIETTVNAETGRFLLEGITDATGDVLITFDADKDGTVDRQKRISIQDVKGGPGRDVELGTIALGRNATVTGKVLLADNPLPTGHFGTTVFISGSPASTTSADDGSFTLENLAEGQLALTFYRSGYLIDVQQLELAGGQELRVTTVQLELQPPGPQPTTQATGTVLLRNGDPAVNALVRFVGNGVEVTATTDSTGVFTTPNLTPGIYQVAIEIPGATSLRLYNVAVGLDPVELETVTLTPGVSTPISLDGGVNPIGTQPTARITAPPAAEPGSLVQLSGLGSSGKPLLRYHWRFVGDAGPLSFSANDSVAAIQTSFTAPTVLDPVTVSLAVSDGDGVMSQATTATIASRPIAKVTASQYDVPPGGSLTVDGSPSIGAAKYLWETVATAALPGFTAQDLPTLQLQIPAAATPGTVYQFKLTVANQSGLQSRPTLFSVVVASTTPWSVSINVTPPGLEINVPDAGILVTLFADVANLPSNPGPITYNWVPISGQGFFLNQPTSQSPYFFAPLSTTQTDFSVTVTIQGVSRMATRTVRFKDVQVPTCSVQMSPLVFRVACDKPLDPDAGVTVTGDLSMPLTYEKNSNSYVAQLQLPYLPGSAPAVQVRDVATISGVRVPLIDPGAGGVIVSVQGGPRIRSNGSSRESAYPGWLSITGAGSNVQRVVGRMVETIGPVIGKRLWSLDAQAVVGPCTDVCYPPDTTQPFEPDAGTPARGATVVTAQGRGYAAISNARGGVWQCTPGVNNVCNWVRLDSPAFVAMGSDGSQLHLALNDGINPGLKQFSYQPGTNSFSLSSTIAMGGTYGPTSSAVYLYQPKVNPLVVATNDANGVNAFNFNPVVSMWAALPVSVSNTTEVRAVTLPSGVIFMLTEYMGGLRATDSMGWSGLIDASGVAGFDVVLWGQKPLIAYAKNGEVRLTLWDPIARSGDVVRSASGSLSFNGQPGDLTFLPASAPSMTMTGTELGLAWQELDGSGYHLAGRFMR